MADWRSRAIKVDPSAPITPTNDWRSRAVNVTDNDPGILATLGMKGAQGLTMGFADELYGGGSALAEAAKRGNLDQFIDDYVKARDEARKLDEQMSEAHPYLSAGAEIAGGILPALATGGASAGARIGMAAAQGAAMGLGNSKADLTQGEVGDAAWDTAKGGAVGGIAGTVGEKVITPALRGLSKGTGKVAEATKEMSEAYANTPKPNIEEIKAAAEKLGIDPTTGMLTTNRSLSDLEQSLAQGGTIWSAGARKKQQKLWDKMMDASEGIAGKANTQSDYELGREMASGLQKEVSAQKGAVSNLYNKMNPDLESVPMHKGVVNDSFDGLADDMVFRSKEGADFLANARADLEDSAKNLLDLKEYRTILGKKMRSADGVDKLRLKKIYDSLTDIRDNSIGMFTGADDEAVQGLQHGLSLADAAHAQNLKDINSVGNILSSKPYDSASEFLSDLSTKNAPREQLAQWASKADIDSLKAMQEKFPAVFEKAKQQRINDLIAKSQDANGLNPSSLIKNLNGLDPEVQKMLFTPQELEKLVNMSTVRQSVPKLFNPSQTSHGMRLGKFLSPSENLEDFTKLMRLKATNKYGQETLDNAANKLENWSQALSPGQKTEMFGTMYPKIRKEYNDLTRDEAPQPKMPQAPQSAPGHSFTPDGTNLDAIVNKASGTKYAQVLQNAMANGEQSAAAAHYVLASRDPEYRYLMENGSDLDFGL